MDFQIALTKLIYNNIHSQIKKMTKLSPLKQFNIAAPNHLYFPIMTRARTKAIKENKLSNQKITPLSPKYNKKYLINPTKVNVFNDKKQKTPLKIMKESQELFYDNLINKLRNKEYILEPVSVYDQCYIKLLHQGKLSLRTDGILIYDKRRIIIPPNIRLPIMQNVHVDGVNHAGYQHTLMYAKSRYYWLNMDFDIKLYVSQCM